jgi:hypothetical protein
MSPSDHQGLIQLLSSQLELLSAHHSACSFPLGSPFGSPEGVGEMAPAGWMRAHPYPLPHFFAPSSLHLSHTIITCQASTVTSSRTAAAWSSTTKSRRSSSRNTSPSTDRHNQPSHFRSPETRLSARHRAHIQIAVKLIGSPFSSPFSLQLAVNLLMTPSDHQGLITLLSSPLDHLSAHHLACSL